MGLSYSTINSYRSALSTTVYPVDGVVVGQHPFVIRLLKGMYHLKPPTPRYAVTWDVDKVVEYLLSMPSVKFLSLKDLTYKLVMLVSLTSADRGQSLALMDINKKSFTNSKVTFYITELTKTSAPTKGCKEIVLPAFSDKRICVKFILKNYLKRTKDIRGSCSRLFVSYKKPHKAVTSSTLARWIKIVLCRSGITGYGAHSTRGAASSAACQSGLPIPMILRAADWSKESTFTRFYKRAVDDTKFGRAVLQSVD